MSTEDTPRIGIVGLGNIGHRHARLLRDGNITLAGGADIAAGQRDVPVPEKASVAVPDVAQPDEADTRRVLLVHVL